LFPEFSYLELALVIEPLFIANWLTQEDVFRWLMLSTNSDIVPANHGEAVSVSKIAGDQVRCDTVFVLASFETKTYAKDRLARSWLQEQDAVGTEMVAIQTGPEILAAAGLLDGHRAAVHWDNLEAFQELYPNVTACSDLYTVEPKRLTCAGGIAVADMMLHWMSRYVSRDLVDEVRQHLLMRSIRAPSESQFSDTRTGGSSVDARVGEAVRIMRKHIQDPLPCPTIATMLGISRRQLERQFKRVTDMTPIQYYIDLRLAKAHRLLQQTEMSVANVAVASGFATLEHFSRVYRSKFSCSPSEDRLQSTEAPVMRRNFSSPD